MSAMSRSAAIPDGDITLARHYAAALTTERPLSRRTMEREMLLLSDIPGLKTDVRMAPAADAGGVVMGLGLQRRRFEYGFGINNSGSSSLGRTQLEASVSANGLARFGDQTRLSVSTDSQFERFTYVTLSHRQPLGHDGASVQARISALETDPPNGVSGQARAAGVVFVYPAIRSYQRNLTLSLGIDGLNSDNAFPRRHHRLGAHARGARLRRVQRWAPQPQLQRRRHREFRHGTISARAPARRARTSISPSSICKRPITAISAHHGRCASPAPPKPAATHSPRPNAWRSAAHASARI
ncbi:MAG: ShlB/FhaC/HecB family hemolysin secretion/activation protein [Terricaulis sp.]